MGTNKSAQGINKMNQQRIETIKQACIKVYGHKCLNANKATKPTTKAEKALLKLIDNVLKDEYCNGAGNSEKLNELDFN